MLTAHIYFNGNCKQAAHYESAFGAAVKTYMEDSASQLVVHAELLIHDEVLM